MGAVSTRPQVGRGRHVYLGHALDGLNHYLGGPSCQRPDVTGIARENEAARLGTRHDQCVHGGASTRPIAECRCAAREGFGHSDGNVAALQESVGGSVSRGAPGQDLDENDGRHEGRPKAFAQERALEGNGPKAAFGEPAQPTRVQDQTQRLACLPSSRTGALHHVGNEGIGGPLLLRRGLAKVSY